MMAQREFVQHLPYRLFHYLKVVPLRLLKYIRENEVFREHFINIPLFIVTQKEDEKKRLKTLARITM